MAPLADPSSQSRTSSWWVAVMVVAQRAADEGEGGSDPSHDLQGSAPNVKC